MKGIGRGRGIHRKFCLFSQTLALEYGHYLREKNRHEEAGLVFLRAEYWQMAHDAFVAALNWRQAVCMASHLQFDDTHMADTARSLAGQCILWPFSFSLYSDTVCPLKACFTKSEQCAFGISIACVTILDFIRKFTG